MRKDYPAAHSMDTCWFAVDAVGQVAVFETGEPGHVPEGEGNNLLNELYRLFVGKNPTDEEDWMPEDRRAAALGVYFFSYPDDYGMLAVLYRRQGVPGTPLHIDQLPVRMRDRCKDVGLARLRFDQCEVIQP